MRILGIDPSSTCTGIAIVDAGLLTPPTLFDGLLLRPSRENSAIERITEMVHDMLAIIEECAPDKVVIEIPDGKRHWRMGKINMAALAIYGLAVGAMYGALLASDVRVRAVGVNESTRNMPKKRRQVIVAAAFKNYTPEKDKGMDLSDAAFLALMEHMETVALTAAEKGV